MNIAKSIPLIFRGVLGAFLVQAVAVSAEAAPPSRHSSVPASVSNVDSLAHRLEESARAEIGQRRRVPSRTEQAFLSATRTLESRAHALRETVESSQGARRAHDQIVALVGASREVSRISRDLRISERTRGLLNATRSAVSTVENDERNIMASATPRGRDDRGHDHDHRHDRDDRDDRGRDNRDSPRGILKRLFR